MHEWNTFKPPIQSIVSFFFSLSGDFSSSFSTDLWCMATESAWKFIIWSRTVANIEQWRIQHYTIDRQNENGFMHMHTRYTLSSLILSAILLKCFFFSWRRKDNESNIFRNWQHILHVWKLPFNSFVGMKVVQPENDAIH